jgi:hypothetical protein
MLNVRLSTVFGKPRGRLRPARYDVYVRRKLIGEITTPIVPGHQERELVVHRWSRRTKTVVGVFKDMEQAVKALLGANGIDSSRPFKITNEPQQLHFFDQRGERLFWFDQASYLGDSDDGVYWSIEKNSDDHKWYALAAVGSNTIGVDFLLDYLGPYETWRDAAEAGLEVALAWLKPRGVWVEDKDVEAIREDIRSRGTEG